MSQSFWPRKPKYVNFAILSSNQPLISIRFFIAQMDDHGLYKLFRQYGPIDHIRRSKPAVAYLSFEADESARQFQSERRVIIDGHRFAVDYLKEEERIEKEEEHFISRRKAHEENAWLPN